MKNNLLLFLIIFTINLYVGYTVNAQSCTDDWNCPNLPYQYCQSKWVVDSRSFVFGRDDKIYFTGRKNSNNGLYGPSFLLSVPKYSPKNNPGVSVVYEIKDEVANGPVFNRVNGIAGHHLLPGDKPLIIEDMYKYLPLYGTYNPSTQKYTTAFKQNPENDVFISYSDNKLYRCVDTRLEVLSPIPLDLNDTPTSTQLYNTSYCNGIWKHGSTLLFTQRIYSGGLSAVGFYIGNTDCRSCSIGNPVFSVMDNVLGFAANKKNFFYSSPNGLFSVPINGDTSKKVQLSKDTTIKGIGLDDEAVFYATSTQIVRINLDDSSISYLYDSSSSQSTGSCQCVSSFSGPNCQSCNGTISWSNNSPICHPFNADGSVSYCEADWQCMNPPFTYCSANSCQCRKGFTGQQCQTCPSNNISWSDEGLPTCN